MEEHVLVALTARCVFQVTGAAALDLHTTSGLLLDVLDVGTAMPYYLCSEVEAGDGVYVDRNLLLGPLALRHVNGETNRHRARRSTYPTEFVPLDLLLVAASEPTLVDELGELLLHELVDLGHGLVEALLARAGDVEVQWRILPQ